MAEFDVDFFDSGVCFDEAVQNPSRGKVMKPRKDIKQQPDANKVPAGAEIIGKCTANPDLPGITTKLAAFSAKQANLIAKLQLSADAQLAAKAATDALHLASQEWNGAFDVVANDAEVETNGDAVKLQNAGFAVYAPGAGQPVGMLPEPGSFNLTAGDLPGTLDGSWDPVRGASGYIIEITTTSDVPASWHQAALVTKSSCTLTGLATGTTYFVRVRAFGAAGNGPSSAHEQKVAP